MEGFLRCFRSRQGPGLIYGDCSGSQETEFRSQNGNTGDVDELRRLLEEVSKRLEAYSRAILISDS